MKLVNECDPDPTYNNLNSPNLSTVSNLFHPLDQIACDGTMMASLHHLSRKFPNTFGMFLMNFMQLCSMWLLWFGFVVNTYTVITTTHINPDFI